ncbi:MAG: glycosyltransferase family 61 protein [Enhydrobacter sp.]|nr:glycosyltransferase family 61 protein [Enhydrobacter sp.]
MAVNRPPSDGAPAADAEARGKRRRLERYARRHGLPLSDVEAGLRRWTIGGLTYFRKKPEDSQLPVVEHVPLEAETITSAFVPGVYHPSLPPGTYSGAVYREDRTLVREFMEYDALTQERVPKRVNPPLIDPARVARAPRIDGTCVYLGPLSSHFGHFLLESLPRAWYLNEAAPSTLLLFHSAAARVELPPFAVAILRALEIDLSRIRLAHRDLRVPKLILPATQFWLGLKASPGMCVVFDRIREAILKRRTTASRTPPKVYFSRRNLGAIRGSGRPRAAISNEDEAELFFRERGYEIVRPETLRFEEQVAIVANATHVAGASGSALHLMLFNANPRAKLIELRMKPALNQLLISAIRGNAAFHIWSARRDSPPDEAILDMDVIERAMREID